MLLHGHYSTSMGSTRALGLGTGNGLNRVLSVPALFPHASLRCIKDGTYFCYCTYVLRISRYSGFLWVVLNNTGIFLDGLKLCGESRTYQVLLASKKKIWGNCAIFRDNKPSISKKKAIDCFVFYCFLEKLLLNFL